MSDTADSPESLASRPDGQSEVPAMRVSAPARRRSVWRWLWLPLLIGVLAATVWFRYGRDLGVDTLSGVETPQSAAPIAAVEVEVLRRGLDDAARVNRAMREQVLGLNQRVGLLEDGLAGVERGAAPGIDAVRLAEADFLLRLGEERLRLFADVAGARDAFALADAQLSEVSDPRATSVRQTLALERDALAAVAVADLPVILARLDRLADGVANWPLRGREGAVDAGTGANPPGWWERLTGALDRYFRVRRVDPNERDGAGPLLRERIALDLTRARLLLLRAQGAPALAAIESVRATVTREFDGADAAVTQALGVLDEVRVAPLTPQWPELGESRRELARLRGVPAALPAATAPDVIPAAPMTDAPTPEIEVAPATPAEAPSSDDMIAAPDAAADGESTSGDADPGVTLPGPGDDAGPDEPVADGE